MRTVHVTLGVLSLLWGFLQAPFDHIHPEEIEHHAASGLGHIHVHKTVAGHHVYIGQHNADDDEIDLQWNVTTTAHVVVHADATLTARLSAPVLSVGALAVLIPWHRGHDPPDSGPIIPRAPPA